MVRNILYHVYGLESSAYHLVNGSPKNDKYKSNCVVKTHHLPNDLPSREQGDVYIYLVRDGRDSLVSESYHKSQIVDTSSSYAVNLREKVSARHLNGFGGWADHVIQWINQCDLVLKYEDLVRNPLKSTEQIRMFYDLPQPRSQDLKSFRDSRLGNVRYKGSNPNLFFRAGQKGGWENEMSIDLQFTFWIRQGRAMVAADYVTIVGLWKRRMVLGFKLIASSPKQLLKVLFSIR